MTATLHRAFALWLLFAGVSLAQTPESPPSSQAPPDRTVHTQITAPDENPPSAQAPPTSPRIVEVPLLDCSGLACIDMTTGSGKSLRLLIDTAEANSYLDTKAEQSLGLPVNALQGAGDANTEVQQTVVPGAKLGDLPMGDFPFMVFDATSQANKLGAKPQPFPADGALTFRAFQKRLLTIDYSRHVVRISEPLDAPPACPGGCSELTIKRFGSYGPMTLTATGFSVNGQPVVAQVDTLFTGTMLVYPASVERLGFKKQAKSKQKDVFPFTEGGVKLARFDGAAEAFRDVPLVTEGPLYFFTSDTVPPSVQFDVTVGSGLLSHATVTFDFEGMRMWMEPATPGEAPAH